jgi:peptide deformylase
MGLEILRKRYLSVPDLTANVRRFLRLVLLDSGVDGEPLELEMGGFEARAAQHELDHLDGLLILDRVEHASDLSPRRVYR